MPIPTPASDGEQAVQAAGLAVNSRLLESEEAIRRAVPLARQAAVAVKTRSESTNWRTGRFTGLPIAIFQNWLYEMNREWHFTDGTLCVLWCLEFPDARCDYPKNVAISRRREGTTTEVDIRRQHRPYPVRAMTSTEILFRDQKVAFDKPSTARRR